MLDQAEECIVVLAVVIMLALVAECTQDQAGECILARTVVYILDQAEDSTLDRGVAFIQGRVADCIQGRVGGYSAAQVEECTLALATIPIAATFRPGQYSFSI